MSARPVLEVAGLTAGWGRRPLLRDLALRVGRGERVGVLGPNGAGKTTLFDALAGRLRVRAGSVRLGGEDLADAPLHRRARRGLAYVPQEPSVFADLTVRRNLLAAVRSPAARRAGVAGEGEAEQVDRALAAWALQPLADRRAGALSGGERRRVEVARALLVRPSLLLLDEPFAGLDPGGREALRTGLAALPPRTALLITDHSAEDVRSVVTRVLLLVDGATAFDGPVAELERDRIAWSRYFGVR